jgi:hypothetical protein
MRCVLLLCALLGTAAATPRPDPALFAPKTGWSYAISSKPPAPIAAPTRDQMIEDVAYLQHAINEAWAWSSRSTIDSLRTLPHGLHEAAFAAKDAQTLCDGLAQQLRNTGIIVELGTVCGPVAIPVAAGALDTVPANRNYRWRIEREKDHSVGILTIANFADRTDAGWAGFGKAMKELATTELVIVDLQEARGDDPRTGFALLAAIGFEDYARSSYRAPMFRDGTIAKTVRANVASPPTPRSRTLWSSFSTEADLVRIAREVVPGITRTTRPTLLRVLLGPNCARACQLVVRLVRFQGVELLGSFDDASGDEWGAIRLPHSGIVARFPTASYGPYVLGPLEARVTPGTNVAKQVLSGAHQLGRTLAASRAWRKRKLPSCASFTPSRALAQKRITGCTPRPLPDSMGLSMELEVEAQTAERFLKTCPGLTLGYAMDAPHGRSWVSVSGTVEAISRALQAPFGAHASWGCPKTID